MVPECKTEILMMNGLDSSLKFLTYTVGARSVGTRFIKRNLPHHKQTQKQKKIVAPTEKSQLGSDNLLFCPNITVFGSEASWSDFRDHALIFAQEAGQLCQAPYPLIYLPYQRPFEVRRI